LRTKIQSLLGRFDAILFSSFMGNVRSKKSEGGQGGKRGHSNMTHWEPTEEIKVATRVLRRRQARAEIDDQLSEGKNTPAAIFANRKKR
jgi:hypothetical protein